jgi:hypothetical protein
MEASVPHLDAVAGGRRLSYRCSPSTNGAARQTTPYPAWNEPYLTHASLGALECQRWVS